MLSTINIIGVNNIAHVMLTLSGVYEGEYINGLFKRISSYYGKDTIEKVLYISQGSMFYD